MITIIAVDFRSSKPIYEQIRDNIKHLIITGAIKQDKKLPSIRELAQSTSINPNTIQKAMRELETEGFIYTVPGKGSFVAPRPENINSERIGELYKVVKDTISELIFLGAEENEIIEFIRSECFKGGNTP